MNRTRYVDWLVASTSPEVLRHEPADRLRDWVEGDFDETVARRLESDARAESYRDSCPVEGATADDYRLREIVLDGKTDSEIASEPGMELGRELSVLAGIHFLGLDVDRPFVGVYAQSRALREEEFDVASRRLLQEFAAFSPPSVWWWRLNDPQPSNAWSSDQRIWMGRIESLLRGPDSAEWATSDPSVESSSKHITGQRSRSGPVTVTLASKDDLERIYPAYAEAYEALWQSDPRWRGRLQRSELSDLAACTDAGGLGIARIDGGGPGRVDGWAEGREAGVVAALPGRIRGIPGWEMIEEILFPEFRGKGHARDMQRAFLGLLDRAALPWVIGTIDTDNLASQRTAQSVGRKDAGGWSFHTPASA